MARYDDDDERRGPWLLILLLLLLIAGAAFVYFWWFKNERPEEPVMEVRPTQELVETDDRIDDLLDEIEAADVADVDENDDDAVDIDDVIEDEEIIPAQPDNRQFTVYFDLMKYSLTESAALTIDAQFDELALNAVDIDQITWVYVNGHTDTAGAEGYNWELSRRRAFVVRRYLMDQWAVPRSKIIQDRFGETRPAIETGDGVRRDENRRVEILISFD